ncbi:hypothetical protein EIN_275110 [Entamoeba invadens IP1]|uniref:F-BAR domain-containing protein n=1 Tax=Entamoeba invadens IP1 TaxID=370355 RepID=A0A0A1U1L0_ENTIV|nr:hypothetical protein EIN_275110 [Entamoeba invadens IP1]ELP87924.1 hypothetical protein EIN_275110 [Entamoeba invadens IP1]|eukprot:XP_004254695.1 hypothetical protein EIN_275110 [Entamoeba invadens IP1]
MTQPIEIFQKSVFHFDEIVKKIESVVDTTKLYGDYFSQRGNLEMDYCRKMIGLTDALNARSTLGLLKQTHPKDNVLQTFKTFWEDFDGKTIELYNARGKTGRQFCESVSVALLQLSKEVDAQKKQIYTETMRKVKIYEDLTTFATRSEAYYLTQLRDTKAMCIQINTNKDTKMVSRYQKVLTSYNQSEKEYQNALTKVNTCYDMLYEKEMVTSIKQCYELLQYHFLNFNKIIESVTKQFAETKNSENLFFTQFCESLKNTSDEKENAEINEFFQSLETGEKSGNGSNKLPTKMISKVEELPVLNVEVSTQKEKNSWGFSTIASGFASITSSLNSVVENNLTTTTSAWTNPTASASFFSFGNKKKGGVSNNEEKKSTEKSEEVIGECHTDTHEDKEIDEKVIEQVVVPEKIEVIKEHPIEEKKLKVEKEVVATMENTKMPSQVEQTDTNVEVQQQQCVTSEQLVSGDTEVNANVTLENNTQSKKEEKEEENLVVIPAKDIDIDEEEEDDDDIDGLTDTFI